MKKVLVFILTMLLIVVFSSCDRASRRFMDERERSRTDVYEAVIYGERFTMDGHTYIMFTTKRHGSDDITGFVHDPDCPCHNHDKD